MAKGLKARERVIILVLTSLVVVVPFYVWWLEGAEKASVSLHRFSSYEELRSFIFSGMEAARDLGRYYGWTDLLIAPMAAKEASGQAFSDAPSYSTTNVQVEGVDEADIIKTDGRYIYIASGNVVAIVLAYPPEVAEVVSRMELNGTVAGLFVNGDRIVVFENPFGGHLWREEPVIYGEPDVFGTSIKVYDISNREKPILEREVSLDGWYFNSRMIGDYVYAVINSPAISATDEGEVALPKISIDGLVKTVQASEVYAANVSDVFYTFTTIVGIDIQDAGREPVYETFLAGGTTCMYVSQDNVYLAVPEVTPVLTTLGMPVDVVESTLIYRVHVKEEEIAVSASGKVPGRPLNQFSMDEYEEHFRIATTVGHVSRSLEMATSKNNVYVLDMNLTVVGELADLAPGEHIYSARFMGERCYLVTFKKVDPLFVIDVENPEKPKVLGQLKIPGYSDYLHPYDENHLIGIGKEAVEAEEGDFAWYQGVKISLFDVTDVSKPKEMAKYEIGDRGTDSPVLWDHKALLFDGPRNLLVFPVLIAEIDEDKYPSGVPPNAYGDYVWQGAYVFHISPEQGIVLRGGITHLDDIVDLLKSGYYFDSPYSVKRSLYIDNALYTISNKRIKMNSLETLEEIKQIDLPFPEP